MKKIRKITAIGLSIVLTAFLIVGCGGNTSSDTSDNTNNVADTEDTDNSTATDQTDTKKDEGDKVTLEFFNMKREVADIMDEIIAGFEAEYPNIHIEQNVVSDPSQVLQTRMASGDTPTLFTQWPNATFYNQVEAGYVMDLTGMDCIANVQESALEAQRFDDKDYAALISYNTMGIFYNKTMFEEVGVEVPTTFDELVVVCEKLKEKDYTPFIVAGKEATNTVQICQVFLPSMTYYEGLKDNSEAGTFDAASDYGLELKEVAEKMNKIIEYAQDDVLGTGTDQGITDFAMGKGAMLVGGSWTISSILAAKPDIEIEMFPIPADVAEATNATAFPGDMALCIAEDTEYKEEAMLFLEYMTRTEVAQKYAQAEGNPSCINGVEYVAPQLEYNFSIIKEGRFKNNPDAVWTNAKQEAVGVATQQLFIDGDGEAYLKNMEEAFNNN